MVCGQLVQADARPGPAAAAIKVAGQRSFLPRCESSG